MDYTIRTLRRLSSFLLFSSLAIWGLYVYFKLWAFAEAAISLRYINVQIVSFFVYSCMLIFFPLAALFFPRHLKQSFFVWPFFIISLAILVGTIGDLITYKFFMNYNFVEGDAIFCNILISTPNIYGAICCLFLSFLYFLLGKYITESKGVTSVIYLFIFLISVIPPFAYSYMAWGGYPRQTWVEKAAFLIPYQACLLISFILSYILDLLWEKYTE